MVDASARVDRARSAMEALSGGFICPCCGGHANLSKTSIAYPGGDTLYGYCADCDKGVWVHSDPLLRERHRERYKTY